MDTVVVGTCEAATAVADGGGDDNAAAAIAVCMWLPAVVTVVSTATRVGYTVDSTWSAVSAAAAEVF